MLICIVMSTTAVAKGKNVWKVQTGQTQKGFTFRTVEFTPEATIVNFDFKQDDTFMFPAHTRLITDQGEVLSFIKTEGAPSSTWVNGTEGKTLSVAMHFTPAKQPIKWLHYYEGKTSGDWKTFFIQKAGSKPMKIDIPDIFKNVKYDDKETLPATKFNPAPTRLHVYTNLKSLDLEASTFIDGFGEKESDEQTFDIKNGECIISTQLFFPRTQGISVAGRKFACIMEPGKDAYCYVDLSKKDGEKGSIIFAGNMAKTNQELVDKKLQNICVVKFDDPSYLCTTDTTLSVDQRFDMIQSILKSKIDSINNGDYSDNVKTLLRMNTEYSNQILRLNYSALLYKLNQFKKEDIPDMGEKMLPFRDAAKKLGNMEIYYSPYATLCPGCINLSCRHIGPDGKENTLLKDLTYLSAFLKNMSEEKYLEFISDSKMLEYAKERKAAYQARMDSLRALQNTDAIHFKEFDDVAPEAILDTITNRYKGKAILIDIWATWCGPCRQGHKLMKPLKEEMKDKNISFVYISSPSSPEGTWRNMIAEIPGDHYYLTQEQYSNILHKYDSEGIPTYIIFDKNGNSQYSHIGFPSLDELRNEINKAMK